LTKALVALGNFVDAVEILYDKIDELLPQSEAERSLKSQALTVALDLGQKRS